MKKLLCALSLISLTFTSCSSQSPGDEKQGDPKSDNYQTKKKISQSALAPSDDSKDASEKSSNDKGQSGCW